MAAETYIGLSDGHTVKVITTDGKVRTLHHVVVHSPTGFSWGYGGSGPSDLALSILCDYSGFRGAKAPRHEFMLPDDHPWRKAWKLHHHLKDAFVSRWPSGEDWMLSKVMLEEWLTAHAAGEQEVTAP